MAPSALRAPFEKGRHAEQGSKFLPKILDNVYVDDPHFVFHTFSILSWHCYVEPGLLSGSCEHSLHIKSIWNIWPEAYHSRLIRRIADPRNHLEVQLRKDLLQPIRTFFDWLDVHNALTGLLIQYLITPIGPVTKLCVRYVSKQASVETINDVTCLTVSM